MAKPHDWEWLRRENYLTSDYEVENDRQLQNLKRWIHERDLAQLERELEAAEYRKANLSKKEKRRNREQQGNERIDFHQLADSDRTALAPENLSQSIANQQLLESKTTPSQSRETSMSEKKPAPKDTYQEWLKQDFNRIFEALTLKESQRHYLRSRWLDQVLWMEGRANRARDMYFRLRLTTIIGGVMIPALVSLNFTGVGVPYLKQSISISTFALSQLVAICAATEQFFNYGDRWRHYRRGVESLKTQGWQFFELSDNYQTYQTHEQAFVTFAAQVEQILQRDVEVYATQVTQKEENPKQNESVNVLPEAKPEIKPA